jgi:hypothetical protein
MSKAQTEPIRVTGYPCYRQMGYHDGRAREFGPDIKGMTLRQALRALREDHLFGERGYMYAVSLSDGSQLSVCNSPAYGGGILLGVHRAEREWLAQYPDSRSDTGIRTYQVTT